jgi:hypothetical protein
VGDPPTRRARRGQIAHPTGLRAAPDRRVGERRGNGAFYRAKYIHRGSAGKFAKRPPEGGEADQKTVQWTVFPPNARARLRGPGVRALPGGASALFPGTGGGLNVLYGRPPLAGLCCQNTMLLHRPKAGTPRPLNGPSESLGFFAAGGHFSSIISIHGCQGPPNARDVIATIMYEKQSVIVNISTTAGT